MAPQKTKRTTTQPKTNPELSRLREEFVAKTEEYKSSLKKLLALLDRDVQRAEEKLATIRKLRNEGLVGESQVTEAERAVQSATDKAAETRRQLAEADQQVAALLNEAKLDEGLAKEYGRAVAERRRSRAPKCNNWTLTAYRRQRENTTTFGFKLVCQD